MKINPQRYGCKNCKWYDSDSFEYIYKSTYHCASCRLNQELIPIKSAFEELFLYRLAKNTLDALTNIILNIKCIFK